MTLALIKTHDGRERRRRRDEARCPACAEDLPRDAYQCASCGERRADRRRPRRLGPTRSPGLAAALAAIFPGAGHFYCERFGAGLLIMFGVPVTLFVLLLAAIFFTAGLGVIPVYVMAVGVWIWQVFDAHASASAPPPAPRRPWRRRGRR